MSNSPLHLFAATGIELEYMIVSRADLAVRPLTDKVLAAVAGEIVSDVDRGPIGWSNELALHVLELKTSGPSPTLAGVAANFATSIAEINGILAGLDAQLLPGGMHPTMDPDREMVIWPHEYSPIYEAFNRIFDCRGHGWANLQSMHINLPFADDQELARLHAAIRLLLPIMPALAASSPISGGAYTGWRDTRMEVYRSNARKVPSVSGVIVPERAASRAEYEEKILGRIYTDLAPHDPDGILRHEWVNARGCIARFDRMALEIRVLDTQERPQADLAIAAQITAVLRALVDERLGTLAEQSTWHEHDLARIFRDVIRSADQTVIDDARYRQALGCSGSAAMTAGELWRELAARFPMPSAYRAELGDALALILDEGCLARRLEAALGPAPSRAEILATYRRLGHCLARSEPFVP